MTADPKSLGINKPTIDERAERKRVAWLCLIANLAAIAMLLALWLQGVLTIEETGVPPRRCSCWRTGHMVRLALAASAAQSESPVRTAIIRRDDPMSVSLKDGDEISAAAYPSILSLPIYNRRMPYVGSV